MPGVVRKPDLSSYPKSNVSASTDTIANNLQIVRNSDARFSDDGTNIGVTIGGAEVFVNGLHIQYIGHANTKSTQVEGSPNVIAN